MRVTMGDEFLFSKWARLLGAATCAILAHNVCESAAQAGILDFSNDIHWRARAAAIFWAVVVGWLLPPPAGIEAGLGAMLVGAAIGLFVGAAELTVSYVWNGFSLPTFFWTKVAFFVFMPTAFAFMVPAFLRTSSALRDRRPILERLISHPLLSLFFGACTVVGTAATIWPELGARIHGWF